MYDRHVRSCATSDCQRTLGRGSAKYRVTKAHVRHARSFKPDGVTLILPVVAGECAFICSICRLRFQRDYVSLEAAADRSRAWRDSRREAAPALLIAAAAAAAARPRRFVIAAAGSGTVNAATMATGSDLASYASRSASPTRAAASTSSAGASAALCAQDSGDAGIDSGDAADSASQAAAECSDGSGHILTRVLVAFADELAKIELMASIGRFGRNPVTAVDFNICCNVAGQSYREWFAEPFFKMRPGDRMRVDDSHSFILVGAPHLLEACSNRATMYHVLSTGTLYLVVARHFLNHLALLAQFSPFFETARVEGNEEVGLWLSAFEPQSSGVDSLRRTIYAYGAALDEDKDFWKIAVSGHIAFL
jgi:hypothetical protein